MIRILLLALALLAAPAHVAQAKPFQRALVIGGGGITPGLAIGIIAGARSAGYEPDLVITTCGSSLGAALLNSFPSSAEALDYAKSPTFHQTLTRLVQIDSRFAWGLKSKFDGAIASPNLLPNLFTGNILSVPESIEGILPKENFPSAAGETKFIILGARAGFGPEDTGREIGRKPLFKEVFFTDAGTAKLLKGRRSTVKKLFPQSLLVSSTETHTGVGMAQAARVSISDPYYINPAAIGADYYFGGAIDLFPIETALDLADEVLVNFPSGLYSDYENLAIQSTFGFRQSDRTKAAAKHKEVKWIDSSSSNLLGLDPSLSGIIFVNNIPGNQAEFAAAVQKQYDFGFARAVEAVKRQQKSKNVRSHLRFPHTGTQ